MPVDWELWFAYQEPVPANYCVDVGAELVGRLRLATLLTAGVESVGEFMEMVLWEALRTPERAVEPRTCPSCGEDPGEPSTSWCGTCLWVSDEYDRLTARAQGRRRSFATHLVANDLGPAPLAASV